MAHNYEDIVRDWYNKLQPGFIKLLTSRYSGFTLQDAENIYQDAFIAVYQNINEGKVKEETSWRSYILRIGMNIAAKEWRKKGKTLSYETPGNNEEDSEISSYRTFREVEDIIKTIPGEDDSLFDNPQAQSLLGDEVSHIPEPCRTIILLFYYEHLSMNDIAVEIGYKNSTSVKSKRYQCMQDLIRRVTNSFKREGLV